MCGKLFTSNVGEMQYRLGLNNVINKLGHMVKNKYSKNNVLFSLCFLSIFIDFFVLIWPTFVS